MSGEEDDMDAKERSGLREKRLNRLIEEEEKEEEEGKRVNESETM